MNGDAGASDAATDAATDAGTDGQTLHGVIWKDANDILVPGLATPIYGDSGIVAAIYFDDQGVTWTVNIVSGGVNPSAGTHVEWWAGTGCAGTAYMNLEAYAPRSSIGLWTATATEYRIMPDTKGPAGIVLVVQSSGNGFTCSSASTTSLPNAVPVATTLPTVTQLPSFAKYAFPLHPEYLP